MEIPLPVLKSTYKRPLVYFNSHLETILPAISRKVPDVQYERERITTPDDDFLDLDWLKGHSQELVILSHGLEGSTDRAYMKGMARAFHRRGYEVLAWNFRGCSEEINRQLRFYHSGATDDFHTVVQHALRQKSYRAVFLIGFSMGGNITLKYLGEKGKRLSPEIKKAVAFSVPLDLHAACLKISTPQNFMYSRRFLRNLKEKITRKAKVMPNLLDTNPLSGIKTLMEFDDCYTAPLHGFENALHYYHSCSAIHYLDDISIPTLVLNAWNDPFLSEECYPVHLLEHHPNVYFDYPEQGGHVGFTRFKENGLFWSEERALEFVAKTS